jgi:hypothetical protein
VKLALLLAAALSLSTAAQGVVSFEWVHVDDPGNPPDLAATDPFHGLQSSGWPIENTWHVSQAGSVPYVFDVARDELTVAQYVAFLNAVAADDPHELLSREDRPHQCNNSDPRFDVYCRPPRIVRTGEAGSYSYEAAPGLENHPIGVHPFAVMRFMNWLHNGQPTGPVGPDTTESGAYDCVNVATEGDCIFPHQPGARFHIPTLDEMHKAAFWNKETQTWHWWPTVPGVTVDDAPVECSPGINPCPDPPTGNEVNTAGPSACHTDFPPPFNTRGCEYLPVASHPATTSPFGLRDVCGGMSALVEEFGEEGGVANPAKIMGHPIAWWGTSTLDCQASIVTQSFLRNQNGLLGVKVAIRPVRVPAPGALLGEAIALAAVALLWRASRERSAQPDAQV